MEKTSIYLTINTPITHSKEETIQLAKVVKFGVEKYIMSRNPDYKFYFKHKTTMRNSRPSVFISKIDGKLNRPMVISNVHTDTTEDFRDYKSNLESITGTIESENQLCDYFIFGHLKDDTKRVVKVEIAGKELISTKDVDKILNI